METRSNNVLVGAVTLLLLLAVAAFTVWLANNRGGAKREFDIFFNQSVDGLNKGAMVTYSGVPAGQVKTIALWPQDPQFVRVRIEVDEEVPVLQGTTAALQGSFTGVTQLILDGAVKGAPPITAPGPGPGSVPVIPTRQGGLGALLSSAPKLMERLGVLTERLTELADDKNQRSVANILTNVEATTGTLARSTPQLEATLRETQAALRQAGVAADRVGALAVSTQGSLERNVDPAMADLRSALASANTAMATLNKTIADAQPGMQAFSQTTVPQANALIRDLRATSNSLTTLTEQIEQNGLGGLAGGRKLPDYKPK